MKFVLETARFLGRGKIFSICSTEISFPTTLTKKITRKTLNTLFLPVGAKLKKYRRELRKWKIILRIFSNVFLTGLDIFFFQRDWKVSLNVLDEPGISNGNKRPYLFSSSVHVLLK